MLIAGQRVADQDGVRPVGIELAIGLIGDLERREVDAAIEPQRLVGAELRDLRSRMIDLVRALLRRDRPFGFADLDLDVRPVICFHPGHRQGSRTT